MRQLTLTATLLALSTAGALAFPASFSLEVGRPVDLSTLGAGKNATITSSHPDLVRIDGKTATALHLTPDGSRVTLTVKEGNATTRAVVTTHGIEYGLGKGTVLRPGEPMNSFRILIVRARTAEGSAPQGLESAYGFNGTRPTPQMLKRAEDGQRIGNMLVYQWQLDGGQNTWEFLLKAGSISRAFKLDREVLTPVQTAPAIRGTLTGRTLTLTGTAPDKTSMLVRLTGSPALTALPSSLQPGQTKLPAQLTLTVPTSTPGNVEVRLYNAPVLDSKSVLPDTFTWTQHPVAQFE